MGLLKHAGVQYILYRYIIIDTPCLEQLVPASFLATENDTFFFTHSHFFLHHADN